MSKLDIISEVLHRRYRPGDQKRIVEDHAGKGGKKIPDMMREIVAPPRMPYLLYRFTTEPERELFPFFADTSGLKQLCDYVLFALDGKQCYCLLIEMKAGSGGAKKQLLAAKEFVHFVITSAYRIGKSIQIDEIEIRFISVNEKKKPKPGIMEQEPEYDADGWVKLTTQALRLPQLLK